MVAPNPTLGLTCVAVSAVAAMGPDIDHPPAPAARCLGPISLAVCHALGVLSWMVGLPKHRGITHTVIAGVVMGAVTVVGVALLPVTFLTANLVGASVTVGWWSALAGDWMTKTSLPHVWWPLAYKSPGPAQSLRIHTGKGKELALKWLVFIPALVVGLMAVLLGVDGVRTLLASAGAT